MSEKGPTFEDVSRNPEAYMDKAQIEDSKKRSELIEIKNSLLKDLGNGLYINMYATFRHRCKGMKIVEKIFTDLDKLIQNSVYTRLGNVYDEMVTIEPTEESINDYILLLNKILHYNPDCADELSESEFKSELLLLIAQYYDADGSFHRAADYYNKSGHHNKLNELISRGIKKFGINESEINNEEKRGWEKVIQIIQSKNFEYFGSLNQNEHTELSLEKSRKIKELEPVMKNFLQKYKSISNVDINSLIEEIRQQIRSL